MRIKSSRWTLLAALLFTVNTAYWYWKHPEDLIGIVIYAVVAVLFYVISIGTWKSGN